MAVTPQAFMRPPLAAGNEIWSSAGVNLGLSVVDMNPILWAILKNDQGFLGKIGGPVGKPAHNVQIEWLEDELNPIVITADYTFADDAADNLVVSLVGSDSSSAALLNRSLRSGTILQPQGTAFMYIVDDQTINSNTITITAYGGDGAGNSDADGSRLWDIVSSPFIPGADASNDVSRARDLKKNYLQILERAVGIDKLREVIRMYTVPDEIKLQASRRMVALHNELNMTCIRQIQDSAGVAADRPTMNGLRKQIEDKGDSNTYKNASSVDLSPSLINDILEKMWDAGGVAQNDRLFLMLNSFQHRKVSAFNEDIIRTRLADKRAGSIITQIQGDIGPVLEVVLDRHMPIDSISIFAGNKIGLRHGQGDQFQMVPLAITGRRRSWQISGSYSLEVHNAGVAHSWLYNLTTS